MTRDEMIRRLRVMLSDEQEIGYPDDGELLGYLDRATVYYSEQMSAVKDPSMTKTMETVGCCPLPDDFIALAGQHPVRITGRHMDYYGAVPYRITYFARLPLPSSYEPEGSVDIETGAAAIIVQLASVFALNRNEYDITQDLALIKQLADSMRGARA